jgi:hypothetical protein
MINTSDTTIESNKSIPMGNYIFILATCFIIGIFVNSIFQMAINIKQTLSINKQFIKDYCYKYNDEGKPYYTNTNNDNDKYAKCVEFRYEKDIFKFSRILCFVSCILLILSAIGLTFTNRTKINHINTN